MTKLISLRATEVTSALAQTLNLRTHCEMLGDNPRTQARLSGVPGKQMSEMCSLPYMIPMCKSVTNNSTNN